MISWFVIIKCVHVLSSTVLMGTGAGIAFFFVRANRTRDPNVIASVAADVVLADFIFTASAVVVQPVTGTALALLAGYPLSMPWLVVSIALYCFIGCCWLPVIWLQIRMRDIAADAAARGAPIPQEYYRYLRWWYALGWPAFVGMLGVFYLMVAKPSL